ncbi:tyrosine-type recombinase/integrase [Enterococcus sp. BWR-S5]|uniref:tyrosine-type recombinase/integrase n=1 Tax=Enterococcus sp. BWR-S5 TaxID=2787714 RepID=UPI001923676B|nr:tyrosine-type recombinase/integrase [Enterococcus sp. BWR-S5]MBL1227126.1 tyrosine-type recombinase/integrase [Enterococcus sp. BWR-S5]
MKIVEPIREKKQIDAMKAILSAGKMGQRNVLLFSIGINTAYRISDLRRLKLSDVLTVSRGKVIAKDRLEMKEQKTGKHNSIIISNKLRRLIQDYVMDTFPEFVAAHDFNHYLFQSRKGMDQPLSRQALWNVLSSAANSIGLKNIGSHSMRKTFGYFLYKNGTHIEIIQELLNHSSQRETLRYIGITQEDKDTAVMSLDL